MYRFVQLLPEYEKPILMEILDGGKQQNGLHDKVMMVRLRSI
jgi:hypothetical protein